MKLPTYDSEGYFTATREQVEAGEMTAEVVAVTAEGDTVVAMLTDDPLLTLSMFIVGMWNEGREFVEAIMASEGWGSDAPLKDYERGELGLRAEAGDPNVYEALTMTHVWRRTSAFSKHPQLGTWASAQRFRRAPDGMITWGDRVGPFTDPTAVLGGRLAQYLAALIAPPPDEDTLRLMTQAVAEDVEDRQAVARASEAGH